MKSLSELWWLRLPGLMARISNVVPIARNGEYLTAWPTFAAFAPLLAILIGLIVGWQRLGAGSIFTMSAVLVSVFIAVGGLNAALGMWMWFGYVIGDFFLYRPLKDLFGPRALHELVQVRGSTILEYVLCASVLIVIPTACSQLRLGIVSGSASSEPKHTLTDAVAQGIIAGILILLWAVASPIIVIAIYRWAGVKTPISAIRPLLNYRWAFVLVAFFAGFLRIYLEHWASLKQDYQDRIYRIHIELAKSEGKRIKLVEWTMPTLRTVMATVMLSALYTTMWHGLALALAIFAVLIIRDSGYPRWAWMSARPLNARLLIAISLSYAIGFFGLRMAISNIHSPFAFPWVIGLIVVSMLVFSILLPPQISGAKTKNPVQVS